MLRPANEPPSICAVALCHRPATTTAITFERVTVACCDHHRRWIPMMAPPELINVDALISDPDA
jgi:hypothetical protein